MNKDDIKKVLEETLEPIKKGLQAVKEDLQTVKTIQSKHTEILKQHTKVLTQHSKVLDQHTEILENRVLPSVITIETTIKGYADAYKTNKANIERLDDRVIELEDRAGIIPTPELTIQR